MRLLEVPKRLFDPLTKRIAPLVDPVTAQLYRLAAKIASNEERHYTYDHKGRTFYVSGEVEDEYATEEDAWKAVGAMTTFPWLVAVGAIGILAAGLPDAIWSLPVLLAGSLLSLAVVESSTGMIDDISLEVIR